MVKLDSVLAVCTKEPRYKNAAADQVNFELILQWRVNMLRSTCMLAICLGSVLAVSSNIKTSQNMNFLMIHCSWHYATLMRTGRRPDPLHEQQCRRQCRGDDKLLTSWAIFPLPLKKLLCNHIFSVSFQPFCIICNCNPVHVIVSHIKLGTIQWLTNWSYALLTCKHGLSVNMAWVEATTCIAE
jgi:hypothetical protein